jgi:hypothetical protein
MIAYCIPTHSHSARIIESDPYLDPPRKAGTDKNRSGTAALNVVRPVRPAELRLLIAIPSAALFPALLIALATLFSKSRPHGTSRMIVCVERDCFVTCLIYAYNTLRTPTTIGFEASTKYRSPIFAYCHRNLYRASVGSGQSSLLHDAAIRRTAAIKSVNIKVYKPQL